MEMEDKETTHYKKVISAIEEKKEHLSYTEEDEKLIEKLWKTYCRKRKGLTRTPVETWAASILWLYSKMNFLWENDRKWTQKALASIFNTRQKTISSKCTEITSLLKIKQWDERFCRKSIAESDPLYNFVMTASGAITSREDAIQNMIPYKPLKKTKEDYYYDGLEYLEENDERQAIACFKKALRMNCNYVDAYNGLGLFYFSKDQKKADDYYKKAYVLTKEHFKGKWPKELKWGILENRQYLRAIHCHGLMLWRQKKINKAMELFSILLKLNKADNQGIRYLIAAIYEGISYEKMEHHDHELEKIFQKQNKIHQFFTWEEDE